MENSGHAELYLMKSHDNAVASMGVSLHAKNKQNNSTQPILALSYFMPDHTQQILHDLTKVSMDI